jgi:hypothetical protein
MTSLTSPQFLHAQRQELHQPPPVLLLASVSREFLLWCPICLEKEDKEIKEE